MTKMNPSKSMQKGEAFMLQGSNLCFSALHIVQVLAQPLPNSDAYWGACYSQHHLDEMYNFLSIWVEFVKWTMISELLLLLSV